MIDQLFGGLRVRLDRLAIGYLLGRIASKEALPRAAAQLLLEVLGARLGAKIEISELPQ